MIKSINWLKAFKSVYLGQYDKIKKLVPDSVWQMYKNLGQTKGAYELDERRMIVKLIRTEWNKRPKNLTRVPDDKSKRVAKKVRTPRG